MGYWMLLGKRTESDSWQTATLVYHAVQPCTHCAMDALVSSNLLGACRTVSFYAFLRQSEALSRKQGANGDLHLHIRTWQKVIYIYFHFGMCHEGLSSDLLDVFWLICTSVWEADLEMLMLMRLLKKLHSCNRLPIFLESSPTLETFRTANHLSMNGKWSLHMRLKQLDLHQNSHLCPSYACSRRRRCSLWNQKQFEVKDHKGSRLSRLAGQRCQRERRWHFFQSSWSSWSSICRTCSIWGCDMARLEVQQDGVCRGFWSWSHGWKFQEWLIMLLIQPLKAGFIKRSKLCYLPFAWFTVVIFHVWFWYIIAIIPYKNGIGLNKA